MTEINTFSWYICHLYSKVWPVSDFVCKQHPVTFSHSREALSTRERVGSCICKNKSLFWCKKSFLDFKEKPSVSCLKQWLGSQSTFLQIGVQGSLATWMPARDVPVFSCLTQESLSCLEEVAWGSACSTMTDSCMLRACSSLQLCALQHCSSVLHAQSPFVLVEAQRHPQGPGHLIARVDAAGSTLKPGLTSHQMGWHWNQDWWSLFLSFFTFSFFLSLSAPCPASSLAL